MQLLGNVTNQGMDKLHVLLILTKVKVCAHSAILNVWNVMEHYKPTANLVNHLHSEFFIKISANAKLTLLNYVN